MQKSGHYINGEWISGLGEEFYSENPATKKIIWQGTHANTEEVDQAVLSAKSAFNAWKEVSLEKRISYLEQFAKILERDKDHLAQIISEEMGKPLWESKTEVFSMIQKVTISIQAYQERCPEREAIVGHSTFITRHKPHGAIAVFGPFNFPGHLPNGHIVPALLAGNTIVFKCSELTPLVGEKMAKMWAEILPKGVFNLIQGGKQTGQILLSHSGIDGIFFTGSVQTGMLILEELGQNPEKILALEMGGNNPLVVTDVTDFEAAAYLIIQSAYVTSGQRCSCARRLIIIDGHEGDELIKNLSHMINSIKVGPYTYLPEPFMGPVISMESADRLLNVQASLGVQGGISLVEMKKIEADIPFLSPGLMDVSHVKNRPDEEYFGPFLQLIRTANFDEAIKEANHTNFGLTASLLSSDPKKYRRFFNEIKAGVINWNHPTTGASSRSPFGGVKKSGNHRPSAYYAADYCTYPVAGINSPGIHLSKDYTPGITFLART